MSSQTKILSILTILMVVLAPIVPVWALIHASDRISTSWPGTDANHTITFQAASAIPAGGFIEIIPDNGNFIMPPGFSHEDIDLAVGSGPGGPFTDRVLASSSSAFADGVSAFYATTTNGAIMFSLNTNNGIAGGEYVQIEMGTNALFGATGTKQIINSSDTGFYRININIYDSGGRPLERGAVGGVMIEPVRAGSGLGKNRSEGTPYGYLKYNTKSTIMSIITNFKSHCRYSTASGTPYDAMTNDFSYPTDYYTQHHSTMLSGLQNGNRYHYYIRCEEDNGTKDDVTVCFYSASSSPYLNLDGTPKTKLFCTDYYITFVISGREGDETSDESGESGDPGGEDGGAGSGGIGAGTGGGRGQEIGRGSGYYLPYPPPPGAPGVSFEGWGYALKDVHILKDGTEQGLAAADVNAVFGAFLEDLAQGTYTFSLWSEDADGRRSSTQSFTFFMEAGTQTNVTDVILSPTISINKTAYEPGEQIRVSGLSAPLTTVEVWYYEKGATSINENNSLKTQTVSGNSGEWSIYFETKGLTAGIYQVKAKSIKENVGESNFSLVKEFGISQDVEAGICAGADLNGDGRVNLTDFSILLYYWQTDDSCADQNDDLVVNLVDFSIMMYYWTG